MTPLGAAGGITILVAGAVCSFATFERVAVTKALVAMPSPQVRAHTRPVPLLGGVALFAALLPVLFVVEAVFTSGTEGDMRNRWIATACMLGVGLADDIHPMNVAPKLVAQTVVCALYILVAAPASQVRLISFGLDLALLLLIVNAFNVVDVMDGLLIVVSGVAALGLLVGPFSTSSLDRFECLALVTALGVGFAFNRPPARMFLGDAGALALGFFLGSAYIAGRWSAPGASAVVHLAIFSIPFFEVVLIATARIRRGRSPLRSSPDHFALRLQDQGGWGRWKVLVVTAAIGLGLDLWVLVPVRSSSALVMLGMGAASVVLIGIAFGRCWRLAPAPVQAESLPRDLRAHAQHEPREG